MLDTTRQSHAFAQLVWRCLLAAITTGFITASLLTAGVLLLA